MEEELNENELEERFYSMLHYADDTQQGKVDLSENVVAIIENPPRSTVRRYWRTSGERQNIYQKVNTPKVPPQPPSLAPANNPQPKEEKNKSPASTPPVPILSLFQSPVPQNAKKTIEIIEHDETTKVVELVTSDEDEVVEIALPPKPTITIDSSDEEELVNVTQSPPTKQKKQTQPSNAEREVSASPVPSVVSSVSDDFIRGDCIALKISSRQPDNHSFDFSLHGSDLVCSTPSKKKKKKKNKEVSSTPNELTPNNSAIIEECFATPKSKAKNKKQKTKPFSVTDVPAPDAYDSDSNQCNANHNKSRNSYTVTEKSMPSFDVYESDSNMSDAVKEPKKSNQKEPNTVDVYSPDDSIQKAIESNGSKNNSVNIDSDANITIDLTGNFSVPNHTAEIEENIVIGNISGFTECDDYDDKTPSSEVNKFCSTKVPAILNEDLDFDNLKWNEKVCKNRRYSLTSFREEMEKFYNESWGGEDFNHRELQKNMSRDKSLWAIDPKDRMPSIGRKKTICNYCSRPGHRDDFCRMKPAVCYMCGQTGHMEPRCPTKICVNCGSPNRLYSTMCQHCCNWARKVCSECGQPGHPASHCPDLWRRYHNTIDIAPNLVKNLFTKKHYQLFCSGCTRRGHLVHTCRISLPFSGLPINSPYVCMYQPIFGLDQSHNKDQPNYVPPWRNESFQYNQSGRQDSYDQDYNEPSARQDRKRQSKSPIVHETHAKRRNISNSSNTCDNEIRSDQPRDRKNSQNSQNQTQNDSNVPTESNESVENSGDTEEKAPDYIAIGSSNHDKKGQMIQDNEVSDSSDVISSARIYITNDIIDKLKTDEGEKWLKETSEKHEVIVQNSDITSFLGVKGKLIDQEAFQTALRDWTNNSRENRKTPDPSIDLTGNIEENSESPSNNIPKNRNNVLRKINNALDSLKGDLGEPNELYKELTYLQNRQQQLMKQKVVNPAQLSNNRDHINEKLKKLNMVLLGQAGLGDGSRHIGELHSLQQKLVNYRQKNIPVNLRKEIGQHYRCIFTAVPREDYNELINSYNVNTKHQVFNIKKKEKSFKINPKKKTFNSIPPQQKNFIAVQPHRAWVEDVYPHNPQVKQRLVEKTMSKLTFFHRRLMRVQLSDASLKKTKHELVRKLHTQIASLNKNVNVTSKSLKKMKKLQGQAQWLLSNVVL